MGSRLQTFKKSRVAASVTVDESLNQTCFSLFFLSNEYLCTILVLLSYLLIIELLTQVTWRHLLILGCQCPQCGFTMQLSLWTCWCQNNLTHQSSWRLKSQRLLRCLDSCFCLTFSDVVLVTSPHPPHPRMCLYYACVCIYMCVYIHTVYVYIYICSICNVVKSQRTPLKVVMSLPYYTLSSLGISNDPPHPLRKILGTPNHALHRWYIVSWLNTERKNFNKAAILVFSLSSFPAPADCDAIGSI